MKQTPIAGTITSAMYLSAAGKRSEGFVIDLADQSGRRIINKSSDTGRWMISVALLAGLQKSFRMQPEQLQYFLAGCSISATAEAHKAGETFENKSTGEVGVFEKDGTSLRSVNVTPSAEMRIALLQATLQQNTHTAHAAPAGASELSTRGFDPFADDEPVQEPAKQEPAVAGQDTP